MGERGKNYREIFAAFLPLLPLARQFIEANRPPGRRRRPFEGRKAPVL
jgi:hypothetical protein